MTSPAAEPAKTHLVVTVHGIRTYGNWQRVLGDQIEARDPHAKVVHFQFGYFSALAFLVPFVRDLVVRAFQRSLRRYSERQRWQRIDIVCHSFGTYIAVNALMRLPDDRRPKVHTLILVASVLKSNYPLDALLDAGVTRIVNECGTNDKVLIVSQLFSVGTGMAGRSGFVGTLDSDCFQNRYWPVNHSGYFDAVGEFMRRNWIPLLCGDGPIAPQPNATKLSASRGAILFLINNADVVKLAVWITPFVVLALYLNNNRLATTKALADEQRARETADVATQLATTREAEAKAALGREEIARQTADTERDRAEKAATETKRQRVVGVWRSLARAALSERLDGDRAALLARQALLFHETTPEESRDGVEEALQQVIHARFFPHVLRGHTAEVRSIMFSPDGTTLASGGEDGTVRLWNLRDMRRAPRVLRGWTGPVRSLRFSPDGSQLVTGSADEKEVFLWDLRRPNRDPFWLEGQVDLLRSVAFSGTHVAAGGRDGTIVVWDLRTAQNRPPAHFQLRDEHDSSANAIAFSPDGRYLVAGGEDRRLRLWDMEKKGEPPVLLPADETEIRSVALAPGGRYVASGGADSRVRIRDLQEPNASPRVLSGHGARVNAITFDSTGNRLVSASDDETVGLWDLTSERATPTFIPAHQGAVNSVAFSADGNRIASAGNDKMVRVWDLRDRPTQPMQFDDDLRAVTSLSFAPGTQRLAVASDISGPNVRPDAAASNSVRLWNLQTPSAPPVRLAAQIATMESVAFSSDGRYVAAGGGDNVIREWDVRNRTARPREFRAHLYLGVKGLAFAPDGRLASAGGDNSILLWDQRRNLEPRSFGQPHLMAIALDPNGTRLAAGGQHNTVSIWNLSTPNAEPRLLEGPTTAFTLNYDYLVRSIAFSPDGTRLAVASDDGSVSVWNVDDGKTPMSVHRAHRGEVRAVAFSPDGYRIVSGGSDSTVRLWDLRNSGAVPVLLDGHRGEVTAVAFSPDGSRIVSGSSDGVVRAWSLWSAAADALCSRVWRNLTDDEWRFFVGDDFPHAPTCDLSQKNLNR